MSASPFDICNNTTRCSALMSALADSPHSLPAGRPARGAALIPPTIQRGIRTLPAASSHQHRAAPILRSILTAAPAAQPCPPSRARSCHARPRPAVASCGRLCHHPDTLVADDAPALLALLPALAGASSDGPCSRCYLLRAGGPAGQCCRPLHACAAPPPSGSQARDFSSTPSTRLQS